jgi:unsaturated chondroitin disaccharide hydrolase
MHQSNPTPPLHDALNLAQRQVRRLIEAYPGFYPLYTDHGRWKHDKPAWTRWCDGFLPGMMWLFLESGMADDPGYWRKKAEEYSARLEERKEDRDVHDLGFIFYHGTYKRWYEATVRDGRAEQRLKDVVIRAGQVLAMRFKEKGQYLRSFISDESLFIDIMMNVPIIFYASREGNRSLKDQDRSELYGRAMAHCLTTRRVLVRGDGSTAHEGIFNTATGEFLRQTTHQGLRGDSCWSRGLAWSLYGFTTCAQLAEFPPYLSTAEANADFWLQHTLSDDGIAPWDFDAAREGGLVCSQPDSSASAIAASGLLTLATVTKDPARAAAYRDFALITLETLCKPPFLATDDKNWEGILKRGVYHIHKGLGVDESVMWGEFFFVEALVKALAV